MQQDVTSNLSTSFLIEQNLAKMIITDGLQIVPCFLDIMNGVSQKGEVTTAMSYVGAVEPEFKI